VLNKAGREDIFKPKTGNESLHELSNHNWVKTVTVMSKKIKSQIFLHHNIHKYSSADGKTVTLITFR